MLGTGLLAALTACSSMTVRTDNGPAVDLSVCRSYSWLETVDAGAGSPFSNPLNTKRMRDALGKRLQAHGMAPVESGIGDCQVGYAYGSRTTIDNFGYPYHGWGFGWYGAFGPYGRYPYGPYGGLGWYGGGPYAYTEHRMSLDLFRAGSETKPPEPLWHGSVEVDFGQLTGAEAEKKIDAAATALFKKFPGAATVHPPAGPA
jgi:hypothetical protein